MKQLQLISILLGIFLSISLANGQNPGRTLEDCPWTSSDFPFVTDDSYLRYSWSSGLYMPSQIGGAQTMTKLRLRVNNSYTYSYSYSDVHIYVRHTNLTSFPDSKHPYPSTNNYSGFTKVYQGTMTFNSPGIYTFNFGTGSGSSSSFVYNGEQNLEVLIENRGGDQPSQTPWITRTNPTPSTPYIGKRGGDDDSWGWGNWSKTAHTSRFEYNTALQFNLDGEICAYPLPVELISSNLDCNSNEVEITWSTATETNNDYYTIEYSPNGSSWEKVSRIDGAGNSSDLNEYKVNLRNIHPGISYYRLSQTDFDGTHEILNTFSADCSNKKELVVYPNISSDFINIQIPENFSEGELQLLNTQGQNQSFPLNVTSLTTGVADVSHLSTGVYLLRFIARNGETWMQRIYVE